MTKPPVVYFTFGNHMHWADMTWLWGDQVLPSSVRDMLWLCREAGVYGNVNFDGAGYERLAIDDPEAFAELREAVLEGTVEIVGGSYGQPYGLFHGGESNVRQRVVGARTVRRLFDVRLRTFWEEEFDFFPQLPQMLAGVGVSHASLFFQWTWHTPHLPEEEASAIWWTGLDGTRLLTAPRGPLNLHQWPEDVDRLLTTELPRQGVAPAILQWLELMPNRDWMCRAELILPPLQRLLAREDIEVRPATLSGLLDEIESHAVERSYGMVEVFHGVSLGKNGDLFRRLSRRTENQVQAAEALATAVGFMGRPYPRWDVYPTWELEEAWRELLIAQHHDNDECEGLCGHIGKLSYERSLGLSRDVLATTGRSLAARSPGGAGRVVTFNPLGWSRDVLVASPAGGWWRVNDLPAFGVQVVEAADTLLFRDAVEVVHADGHITLRRGALQVRVDRATGLIEQLYAAGFDDGVLAEPLGAVQMRRQAQAEAFDLVSVDVNVDDLGPFVLIERESKEGEALRLSVRLAPLLDAVDLHWASDRLPRPDPGIAAALSTRYRVRDQRPAMLHDHPYGVSEIEPKHDFLRKYPSGDWMTSPQWFEQAARPFTALTLLELRTAGGGLLLLHDGSQAFGLDPDGGVRQVLSLYDPWDEEYFASGLAVALRLVPHRGMSHADRWRLAQEFTRPALSFTAEYASAAGVGEPDQALSVVRLRADPDGVPHGVLVTALYREHERAGAHFENYAGHGMGYPLVVRLVEFDGKQTAVALQVRGTVARAFRTDLLGERGRPIPIENAAGGSLLRVEVAPHGIVTLYLDVIEARKEERDLDAERSVWAQVHRVEDGRSDAGAVTWSPAESGDEGHGRS